MIYQAISSQPHLWSGHPHESAAPAKAEAVKWANESGKPAMVIKSEVVWVTTTLEQILEKFVEELLSNQR